MYPNASLSLNNQILKNHSNKHKERNEDAISESRNTILKSVNSNSDITDDDKTVSDYSDNMGFTLSDDKMSLNHILLNDLNDSHGDDSCYFYHPSDLEPPVFDSSEKTINSSSTLLHSHFNPSSDDYGQYYLQRLEPLIESSRMSSIESEYFRLASLMNIPHNDRVMLVNVSIDICNRLIERKMMKGYAYYPLMIASFLIGCRKLIIPCTFLELSRLTDISKKDIGKYTKMIQSILQETIEPVNRETYVERYAIKLGMSGEDIRLIQHVVNNASESVGLGGRCHLSIIAGCMYAATFVSPSMSKYSKKIISEAVGVAEVTITNSFRAISPYLYKIFPIQYRHLIDNEEFLQKS